MDIASRLRTCHSSLQSGNIASAEQQYGTIISDDPMCSDAHHLGSMIASRAARSDIAIGRINQALQIQPKYHEYLNTKGNILVMLQDAPAAITAYEEALRAKPDYLSAAQNLGRFLINEKDPISALKIYETALALHPTDKQLLIGRAIALKDAIQPEEALAALNALEDADQYAYLRGQILMQLSRHDEAITANIAGTQQNQTAIPALKNLLQIYWMRGEWDKAIAFSSNLLTTANSATHVAVAGSYILAEEYTEAGNILQSALNKFGRDPFVLTQQALLKLKLGQVDNAWADALEALTSKPGDLKIMETYGECALASGRPNDAMIAAEEALKIIPNNQYWIAMKYTAGRAMGQNHRYYANYDSFVRPYELQPPDGYSTIEEYNTVLKNTLNEIHEFNAHPLDQSLRSGVQTPMDLRLVDHPVLKAHFKALEAPIRAYMRDIGNADPNHPLLRRNTGEYRITGSWSARLNKGGFHVNHVHPDGWISSAYYVDVPDEVNDEKRKSGWIHFGEPPFPIKGMDGNVLGYEKIVKPKAGTLVLFPSYLWHGTNPLIGDKSRMTLPIDVVPA